MNHIREKRDVCCVLVVNPESSSLHEGPFIDGMIILQCMLNKVGCVSLIYVAHDRDQLWGVVSTVMNFQVL
jgi:hypothetical protein